MSGTDRPVEKGRGPDQLRDGLHEMVRAVRQRDWRTQGVPTFLLLDDQTAPAGSARIEPEDHALGRMAEETVDLLSGAARNDDRPSLRDITSLALEVLAARRFAPLGLAGEISGDASGGSGLATAIAAGRYVRAVSYHATPRWTAERLEEQLARLGELFAPVSYSDLLGLVENGEWPHQKPGVILNFFDGHRDNLEVAVPALERAGLIGWFFVVPAWISTPPHSQRDFALRRDIDLTPEQLEDQTGNMERIALLPREVGALAERGHVVASHTLTHAAVDEPGLSPESLWRETFGSKREIERFLDGHQHVRALAWRNGSRLGSSDAADDALREAGYELVFANGAVQRVRQTRRP